MTISEWIAERRRLAEAATKALAMDRYWHGGGRTYWEGSGGERVLVADFYGEGNREFFYDARTSLPAALDALEAAYSALIAMHNIESYDRLACDGALRRIEAILAGGDS